MSKIKLTGHASGTGVLTVTAPNTSTDRTITLPDATGTLSITPSITDNGNATAITIDSSERVGIGANSLSRKLTILTTDQTDVAITAANNQSAQLQFGDPEDDNIGAIQYNNATNYMALWVNAAERMRIDSSGQVNIGTATNKGSTKLTVESDTSVSNPMAVSSSRTTAATDYSILFYRAGSIVGSVQTSLSATSYVTSSDYRLKENVVPMTGSIDRLKELKPSKFNFIADADKTVDGFLAHEAQTVVPEAISGNKDAMTTEVLYTEDDELPEGKNIGDVKEPSVIDPQGIDQGKLVPLLTSALQEAVAKIEELTTRIEILEAN